jgi:ankyrin repeat protein
LTKEIKDEEKRAAVLALMAEYSVLCAVATGKVDLVAAAVAKGCNMNETDQEDSCLHIAAAQGSNEILRILLNAGAKITTKNKGGMTVLALACVKSRQHGETLLGRSIR